MNFYLVLYLKAVRKKWIIDIKSEFYSNIIIEKSNFLFCKCKIKEKNSYVFKNRIRLDLKIFSKPVINYFIYNLKKSILSYFKVDFFIIRTNLLHVLKSTSILYKLENFIIHKSSHYSVKLIYNILQINIFDEIRMKKVQILRNIIIEFHFSNSFNDDLTLFPIYLTHDLVIF